MNLLQETFSLGLGALFLKTDSYEEMRSAPNPLAKGAKFIIVLGVIVAALMLVGSLLEWSTSRSLSDIRPIIDEEIRKMPWYEQISGQPEAVAQFEQIYNSIWQGIETAFGSPLLNAFLGLLTVPIGLLLRWLIYDLVAYLFARLLGGQGSLGQTLGCMALAAAPQMLSGLKFLPYVTIAGLGTWTLVCSYLALRISGQLSPWRAFWAALLPMLLLTALGVIFAAIGLATVVSIFNAGGAQ